MNNNRRSPVKQQRKKNSTSIPVSNTNRIRSNSSMAASSYSKPANYSPTALSASSSPAVPLFYSNTYADPPECSELPKPPESWYLTSNDETPAVQIEEKKEKIQPTYKNNNKGFYSPFYSAKTYRKFSAPYVSVKG